MAPRDSAAGMSRPGSHSCCCSGLEVPPRWSQTCLLMLRRQRDVMDTVGTVAVLHGRDANQTPKARITNSKQHSDEAISPPQCLPELCCCYWGNIWQKIPPSTASHSLEPPGSQCGLSDGDALLPNTQKPPDSYCESPAGTTSAQVLTES